MATTAFPSDPGIWVWDATACLWTRTTGIPFPTGVTGVYGWDGGGQHWVLVDGSGGEEMGVTDGSNAAPGRVGEFLSVQNNGATFLSVGPGAGSADTDYAVVNSLTLSAGDWQVGAGIDTWVLGPTRVQQFWAYLGSGAPGWSQTDTQIDRGWLGTVDETNGVGTSFSVSVGPIRLNTTATTQIIIGVYCQTDPSGGLSGNADSVVWARRMR